jgi:hypothetical protein
MNKLHRKPRGGSALDQFLLNKNARATIIFHSCQKLIIKTSKGKAASTQKLVSQIGTMRPYGICWSENVICHRQFSILVIRRAH